MDQDTPFPSPEKQKQHIKALNIDLEFTQKKGDNFFLISQKWWNQWKMFVNFDDAEDGPKEPPPKPNPIDNTDLLENGDLKRNLTESVHYSILFEPVWKALVTWYGGGPPIERKMIETGVRKELAVEIYPLRLTLRRKGLRESIITCTMSRATKLADIKKKFAFQFYIPPHQCFLKLDLGEGGKRDLNDMNQTLEEAGVLDGSVIWFCPDQTSFDDENDSTTIQPVVSQPTNSTTNSPAPAAAADAASVENPQTDPQELDDVEKNNMEDSDSSDSDYIPHNRAGDDRDKSGNFFARMFSRLRGKSSTEDEEVNDILTTGGMPLRGGITGLQNLGNTCFMNSALQCLSNTEPLTRYFLEKKYLADINEKNPLGTGGQMAKEYAKLLTRMWCGKYSSVAPSEFKWVVGRFATQFSGYNQHDSQELLAFLLDGLHEDLNRVTTKPYVEKREHNGQRDDEIVAQEAWEDHLKRNQSVIVDLFHGQLRSTVVCPTCNHVSITFDPFMYLSLPLPVMVWRVIRVIFFPLERTSPIAYNVKIEKKAKIGELKMKLAEMAGKNPNSLVLADIYNHKIFQLLDDRNNVSSIRDNDITAAYEIIPQSNANPDKLLWFQVVHRVRDTTYSLESYDLIGFPFILSVCLEKSDNPNSVVTNNDFYNLVTTKIKPYINMEAFEAMKEEVASSAQNEQPTSLQQQQQPQSLALSDLFTLYVTSSVNTKGTEIPRNDSPLNINGRDCVCVQWKSSKFYNPSAEKIIEEKGDKQIESDIRLKDCLSLFCQQEKLGKNDEWYCPKCKEFVQATKKMDLWKLPEILVVHLKRFQYTRLWRDKIDTYVDYPITGFDLSEFVLSGQYKKSLSCVYDLFAISVHSGGLGGGHYTAYALNPIDKQWYLFNDSFVQPVDPDQIKTQGAYVLFYRRRPHPTSAISTIPSLEQSNSNVSSSITEPIEENSDDNYEDAEGEDTQQNHHDMMQE